MDSTTLDEKILRGCKNNSELHQQTLYTSYYGYVLAISRAYSGDVEAAKEMTNDTFLKVFKHIKKYDSSKPFKTWLRRIAVNTAIDHYRKNRKAHYHSELCDDKIESPVFSTIIEDLSVDEIYKLIDKLPATLRIVFNLYEIEGYKHEEIAAFLGISGSSSRTYLMRAKNKLQSMVKESINYPDGKTL